jgi:hypothetical protein
MNDIERIQAIIVTLLEAAQRYETDEEFMDGTIHDDLMNRIVNQSDDAIGLIARRLVEVATCN